MGHSAGTLSRNRRRYKQGTVYLQAGGGIVYGDMHGVARSASLVQRSRSRRSPGQPGPVASSAAAAAAEPWLGYTGGISARATRGRIHADDVAGRAGNRVWHAAIINEPNYEDASCSEKFGV